MSEPAIDYPRITRRTLHDEVLERLRDMIIEARLAPGQRINEGLVGAQLGVSRTPLREAIKTLASEGLVEILPAKGAIVRKFSARDLADILEVLKTLEQLGGRIACEQASDETIEAIHAMHRQMMALYETRSRLEYFKLNQEIHSAIVAASGSKPNSCRWARLMRLILLIDSIMCTGTRMVRAWSAIERVMAWRIHQVA